MQEDSEIIYRKMYNPDVSEDDKNQDASNIIQEISYDKWPKHVMLLISPSKIDKDKFKLQAFDRTKNAVLGNSKLTREELFAMHDSKALHKYPVFLSPELDCASQAYFSGQVPGEVFDNQALVLYRRLSQLTYSESKMETKALVNSLSKVVESPNVLVKVSGLKLSTLLCVQNKADHQKHQSLTHSATNIKSSKINDLGMHVKQQVGQELEPQKNSDLKEPQKNSDLKEPHKNIDLKESQKNSDLKEPQKNSDLKESQKNSDLKEPHKNIDLKESQKNSNLKEPQTNSDLKQPHKNSDLKEPHKNIDLKESQKNSDLKEPQKNSDLKEPHKNSNLKEPQTNSDLKQPHKNSDLKEPYQNIDRKEQQKNDNLKKPHKNIDLKEPQQSTILKQSQKSANLKESQKNTYIKESQKNTNLKKPQKSSDLKESQKNTDLKEPKSSIALLRKKENLWVMNSKNNRTKGYNNNQSSSNRLLINSSKIPSQEKRDQIVNKMQKANMGKTQKPHHCTTKDVEEKTKSLKQVKGNVNKSQTKRQDRRMVTKNKSQAACKDSKKPEVKNISQQRKEVIVQDDQEPTKKSFLQTNRKEIKTVEWKSLSRKVHTIFQNSEHVKEEATTQIKIDNDLERIFTVLQNLETDEKTSNRRYLKENVDQTPMTISNLSMDWENSHKNENIMGNEACSDHKELIELNEEIKYQTGMEHDNMASFSDSEVETFLNQDNSKDNNKLELKELNKEGQALSHEKGNEDDNDPERIITVLQNLKPDEKISSRCYLKEDVDQTPVTISNLNMDCENSHKNENIMGNEACSDNKELIELNEEINYQTGMEYDNMASFSDSEVETFLNQDNSKDNTKLELKELNKEGQALSHEKGNKDVGEILKSSQNLKTEEKKSSERYMEKSAVKSDSLTQILKVVRDQFLILSTDNSQVIFQDVESKSSDQHEIINDNNQLRNNRDEFTCNSGEMSEDSITEGATKSEKLLEFPSVCNEISQVQNKTVNKEQLGEIISSSPKSFPEYAEYENGMVNDNSEELTKLHSETISHDKDDWYMDSIEFPYSEELTETANINEDQPSYLAMKKLDKSTICQKEKKWSIGETETSSIPSEKFSDRHASFTKCDRVEDDMTDQEDKEEDVDKPQTTCKSSKMAKSQSKRARQLKSSKPPETFSLPTVEDNNEKQNKKVKERKLDSGKSQQKESKTPKTKAKSEDKSKDIATSVADVCKMALLLRNAKKQVDSSANSPVLSATDASSSSISKKALPSRNVKEQAHKIAKSPVQRDLAKSNQQQLEENIEIKTSFGKIISINAEDEETNFKINSVKTTSSECMKQVHFAFKEAPDLQSIEEETIQRKGDSVPKICNVNFEVIRPVIELNYSSTCIQDEFKYHYAENYVQYVTSSISSILGKDSSEFEMIIKQLSPSDRITIPPEVLQFCGVRLRQQIRENHRNVAVSFPTLLDEINFRETPSNLHLFEFFRLASKHSFKIYVRPEIVFPGYQMEPRLRLECFLRNNRFVGSVALLPAQFHMFVFMFSQITAEYIDDAFQLTRLPKWLAKSLKRFFNVIHLRFVYDILAELAYEMAQEPASMSLDAP